MSFVRNDLYSLNRKILKGPQLRHILNFIQTQFSNSQTNLTVIFKEDQGLLWEISLEAKEHEVKKKKKAQNALREEETQRGQSGLRVGVIQVESKSEKLAWFQRREKAKHRH